MANKILSVSQVYRKFIWAGLALMAVLLTGTIGYRIISRGQVLLDRLPVHDLHHHRHHRLRRNS